MCEKSKVAPVWGTEGEWLRVEVQVVTAGRVREAKLQSLLC